jgi:hypothetical protein
MIERRKVSREKLKPCPLCNSDDVIDLGYGISCNNCSLWLGDNIKNRCYGNYIQLWNNRDGIKVKDDNKILEDYK